MGLLRLGSGCERICDLPDDLLVKILFFVPTKESLATAILSKRLRHVSKMLPKLTFKDDQGSKSLGLLIDKSLELSKAPKLISLVVELGPQCPVDVDVKKWVEKAVNHGVKKLDFKILWTAKVTCLPKSLYTCDTLVYLTLSNQISVYVSFPASLPSLLCLELFNVVYRDEDSLARLLSSSPVLDRLVVERQDRDDNLTNFTVKVPSLKILNYKTRWLYEEEEKEQGEEEEEEEEVGSLVIDSPALVDLTIDDNWGDYCSLIENMPYLDEVFIGFVPNHDAKFLTCLSSARRMCLHLSKSMAAYCNAIKFSRLIDLFFFSNNPGDWLEQLIFLLQNSPKLKNLTITTMADPSSSWNQPSNILQCLASHLEVVRWRDYEGKEDEKQLMTYILANSKCLKTVEIATCNIDECQKELQSMPRISASSQLIYSTPQTDWMF